MTQPEPTIEEMISYIKEYFAPNTNFISPEGRYLAGWTDEKIKEVYSDLKSKPVKI